MFRILVLPGENRKSPRTRAVEHREPRFQWPSRPANIRARPEDFLRKMRYPRIASFAIPVGAGLSLPSGLTRGTRPSRRRTTADHPRHPFRPVRPRAGPETRPYRTGLRWAWGPSLVLKSERSPP